MTSESKSEQPSSGTSNTGATPVALPTVLGEQLLAELGLKTDDVPAIHDLASRIDPMDPHTVSEFGRDVGEHTSRYADELLGQVTNKDLEEAGKNLGQVVAVARSLNMNALSDRRSRIPVLGPWLDKIKLKAGNFVGQFETAKKQIDGLVVELSQTQKGLQERNVALDQMFDSVKAEHHLLGMHIAAGTLRLGELQSQATDMRKSGLTPTQVQDLADLDSVITNLDIRVGNLKALQHSALQTLPQIRVVQGNNRVLVDKFYTIKDVSIPAWKRQFMLALGLNEQQNAVELAHTIDNMTNDLLRRNAELLHHNSVETAKANQRLVIDTDTLQHVQDTLIKTVEDVVRIQKEGMAQRRMAEEKITAMRKGLQLKLARPGAEEGGN